jgi:hypothetical protein
MSSLVRKIARTVVVPVVAASSLGLASSVALSSAAQATTMTSSRYLRCAQPTGTYCLTPTAGNRFAKFVQWSSTPGLVSKVCVNVRLTAGNPLGQNEELDIVTSGITVGKYNGSTTPVTSVQQCFDSTYPTVLARAQQGSFSVEVFAGLKSQTICNGGVTVTREFAPAPAA